MRRQHSSKKRIYGKIFGLVLAAIGLLVLGLALTFLAHPVVVVVMAAILLVLGLICMASPEATVNILDTLLNWL